MSNHCVQNPSQAIIHTEFRMEILRNNERLHSKHLLVYNTCMRFRAYTLIHKKMARFNTIIYMYKSANEDKRM